MRLLPCCAKCGKKIYVESVGVYLVGPYYVIGIDLFCYECFKKRKEGRNDM